VSDEFEDRRRALDAQYLAALELLREGYRLKLAELDPLRSARAEVAAPPAAVQPPSAPPPPASAAPEPSLALGNQEGCPMVTADSKLFNALGGAAAGLLWVEEIPS